MTGAGDFREAYGEALRGYLLAGGEGELRTAYELGRAAVSDRLSVLELSDLHHDALMRALGREDGHVEIGRIVAGSGDFLREALSAYEMVARSFRDARDGAVQERRHAAMLRGLSDLLTDRTLALDGAGSKRELAMLLAEQARDLCAADAALVTLGAGAARDDVRAVAHGPEAPQWQAALRGTTAAALADLAPAGAKSLRLGGGELAARAGFQRLALEAPSVGGLRGWIVAPLASITGDSLGTIQVFALRAEAFGEVDEQVAVHLAQIAAAALDRRAVRADGRPEV